MSVAAKIAEPRSMNAELLQTQMEAAMQFQMHRPRQLRWDLVETPLGIAAEFAGYTELSTPVRVPIEAVADLCTAADVLIAEALRVAALDTEKYHAEVARVGSWAFGITQIEDGRRFSWLGDAGANQIAILPLGAVVDFGKALSIVRALDMYYGFTSHRGAVN